MARVLCLLLLFLIAPAQQSSALEFIAPKGSIFVFGGQFRTGTFPGWTMIPFSGGMESNFLVGGAYDLRFAQFGQLKFGVEAGSALRFGDRTSVEVWGGPSVRYYGIVLGPVTIIPGFVAGFSAVTNSIGVEHYRKVQNAGNATFLFYLGPEVAFRFASLPNAEFVIRTHHRSGAQGTLGKMGEGANANLFGVRFQY